MKKHLTKLTILCGLLLTTISVKGQNLTLYTEQGTLPTIPIASIRALTFQNQQLNIHFHNPTDRQHIPFETLQKMTFKVYENTLSTNLNEQLHTFPNPIRETLHIHLPPTHQTANTTLQIFSIDGKPIYRQKQTNQTTPNIQIDTKNWERGMYILHIQSANKTETRKIIKK